MLPLDDFLHADAPRPLLFMTALLSSTFPVSKACFVDSAIWAIRQEPSEPRRLVARFLAWPGDERWLGARSGWFAWGLAAANGAVWVLTFLRET